MKKILVLLYLITISFALIANDEDVDHLSITSLLIKDGKIARAKAVLSEIKDPRDVDTPFFYTLSGILKLKEKRNVEAQREFEKAMLFSYESGLLFENYAKSLMLNGKYSMAVSVIEKRWPLLKSRPVAYQIKAESLMKKGEIEKGWAFLNTGMEIFKKNLPLKKQKWFYLYQNNLINSSKELCWSIIENFKMSGVEVAKFAYQYRKKNELEMALKLGEIASKKDPSNVDIAKELARTYMQVDQVHSAATIFEKIAAYEPNYYFEASELWKKAGNIVHAKNLALRIPDKEKNIKQVLTIALSQKNFNELAGLSQQVLRSKLKNDQDIRYALAYANFMLGNYRSVEKHLATITRQDLFKKTLALRESLEFCLKDEGSCF